MFDWFFEFLYSIIKTMLYCIDFITNMAGMLCGITPVTVDGKSEDITQVFLTHGRVLDAFRYVLVIGFILLFVFTIVSVIRSMVKLGEGKTPVQVVLDGAKAMGWFLLVPAFMIIGSMFVSVIMTSVYHATAAGSSSIGSSIFTVIAEEAYDGSAPKQDILDMFYTGKLDYYSMSDVDKYFDLEDLNYFIGFVAPIVVLVLIALSLLAFVERLIHLVLLFVISPLAVSSSVLDDGVRFKLWRDQVINKFLMAYASLIAINIFMLLISVVNTIQFFDSSFLNGLARLVFILGGAIACYKSKTLIGNIINQGAGTQANMDNSAANGIMGGIVGATVGRAARGAMSIAGFPLKKAGQTALGRAKESIGRNHSAKSAVKAEAARNKYSEKILNSDSWRHKSTKSGLMTQADIKKTLYGENHSRTQSAAATPTPAAAVTTAPSGGAPAGSVKQEDRTQNEKAAERVMGAMGGSAVKKDGDSEGKK